MSKKTNTKHINLPIFDKGKLKKEEDSQQKTAKATTIILLISIIILLLLCGYSMAKVCEEIIIKGEAKIAEPILLVESNPSINITATNNFGIYNFKIKNYNEQNKVTEIDLKCCIEIVSNINEELQIELYENDNKIDLNENKTDYRLISKDKKEEREYKVKILYDKDRAKSINDIIEKVQVKVYTEQA